MPLVSGTGSRDGSWRCVVRYTVSLGMTYQRGVWAEELRKVDATGPHVGQRASGELPIAWVLRPRDAR
jgi:hypothetical protein